MANVPGRDRNMTVLKKGTGKSMIDPLYAPVAKPTDCKKKGYLSKRGEINTDWKRRWFMLGEAHLYYFNSQKDTKHKGAIKLLFCRCQKLLPFEEKPGEPNVFKLITPDRVFLLQADSANEVEDWMEEITIVCTKLWNAENSTAPQVGPSSLKQGYLLKQGKNILKDWNRRWFVLREGAVTYYETEEMTSPLGTIPLLQCSVKNSSVRKYCIEFVTPGRTYYAAAKDDAELAGWIDALSKAIKSTLDTFFESSKSQPDQSNTAKPPSRLASPTVSQSGPYTTSANSGLRKSMSEALEIENNSPPPENSEQLKKLWEEILNRVDNKFCADCGSPDPKWASINLGLFVCLTCAGEHRGLSVQNSKIRSVELDLWDVDTLEFMAGMGNKRAREIWEWGLPPDFKRPTPDVTPEERKKWIRNKYVDKIYADPGIIKRENAPAPLPRPVQSNGPPFHEGYLTKCGPKEELIRSWKRRWFVMKENYIYYYATKEAPLPIGGIPLTGAKVKISRESTSKQNCFEIGTANRDYLISADDSSDMNIWIGKIRNAIDYYRQAPAPALANSESGGSDSSYPSSSSNNNNNGGIKRLSLKLNPNEIKRKGIFQMKTGPLVWKKILGVLYKNYLYLYESEKEVVPLQVIDLASAHLQTQGGESGPDAKKKIFLLSNCEST